MRSHNYKSALFAVLVSLSLSSTVVLGRTIDTTNIGPRDVEKFGLPDAPVDDIIINPIIEKRLKFAPGRNKTAPTFPALTGTGIDPEDKIQINVKPPKVILGSSAGIKDLEIASRLFRDLGFRRSLGTWEKVDVESVKQKRFIRAGVNKQLGAINNFAATLDDPNGKPLFQSERFNIMTAVWKQKGLDLKRLNFAAEHNINDKEMRASMFKAFQSVINGGQLPKVHTFAIRTDGFRELMKSKFISGYLKAIAKQDKELGNPKIIRIALERIGRDSVTGLPVPLDSTKAVESEEQLEYNMLVTFSRSGRI